MENEASEERTPQTLSAHAARFPEADSLSGAPGKGWYFAVLVRAAYSRLEGAA